LSSIVNLYIIYNFITVLKKKIIRLNYEPNDFCVRGIRAQILLFNDRCRDN
jgi:hypothetical protein